MRKRHLLLFTQSMLYDAKSFQVISWIQDLSYDYNPGL